jgi:hypothetical protein
MKHLYPRGIRAGCLLHSSFLDMVNSWEGGFKETV